MRIGLICDEYPPRPHGGIGTFVSVLANGLSARGHAVRVYEMGARDGSRHEGRVEVHTVRASAVPRIGPLLDRLRLRAALNRAVAAGEIDILETPDFLGPLPFGLDPRCPVLVRLHGSLTIISRVWSRRTPPLLGLLEVLSLGRNRDWVGVSRHAVEVTRAGLKRARPRSATVIFLPVDVTGIAEPAAPVTDESGRALPARYLLHSGTVSEAKGVVLLAEAARLVLARDPGLHLVFAGRVVDGDGHDTRARIRERLGAGLAERCRFLGHRSRAETLAVTRRALVVVSASRFETFGLSVGEAMALGRPVVVPDRAPFSEWIVPDATGILVAPDDARALADGIARCLDDPDGAERIGRAAAAYAARDLSPELFLDRTVELYKRHIARVRPARPG